MTQAELTLPRRSFGQTMRADAWWAQPLLVFLGLARSSFIRPGRRSRGSTIISALTFRRFIRRKFSAIRRTAGSDRSRLGGRAGCSFRRRFSILWAPGGFRLTCYYYRGAYYKAFWADPPACAVGEPRKTYLGERSFPLIMQNVHRYFLYLALLFILVLAHDVWKAMWFTDPATGKTSFGIGVGTLVLAVNVVSARRLHIRLSFFATSCRWISRSIFEITGLLQRLSPASSCFNRRHMLWAWMSLFWVGFSDLYVRLCAMGIWHDCADSS